ncbi:MAG TPA: zinc finger Ran-binding domain-containing protein [Gemmatimonadaceae bacterium]|nr:zinc finger Ran-binding domain-containing protein [Gemmatimonadaceae bacterium]
MAALVAWRTAKLRCPIAQHGSHEPAGEGMTQPAVNTEQVTALFEERQRFEAWLSMLESKRASTPAHIFERVYADYASRLAQVIEELGSHRAALQELERAYMDRLTTLDADDAKNRDEALEAELRSTVGELSPEHHEEVRSRTETAMAAVADERSHVAAELAKLRAMLEASGAAPTVATPAAPQIPEPPQRRQPMAAGAPSGPPKREESQLTFDRAPQTPLRPAAQAVPAPAAEMQPGSAAGRRNSAPDVRAATGGPFDDLEFLKTMIEPRTSGEGVAVGSGAGTQSSGSRSAASGAIGSQTPPQVASTTGASLPAVGRAVEENSLPKEGGHDQVKTLKCQECGTLNYPTEWYCERCGAELAAL